MVPYLPSSKAGADEAAAVVAVTAVATGALIILKELRLMGAEKGEEKGTTLVGTSGITSESGTIVQSAATNSY
jgi:hypothetical protein